MVMTADKKCVNCAIVGDGMVGKTCLALGFTTQSFPESYIATVFENYAGRVSAAGEQYTVSMFDSAGQHDYEGLRAFTYKDSEVLVVCYSVVDRESFDSIKSFWMPEIKNYMRRRKPVILVATQKDLRNFAPDNTEEIPITREEGEALSKDIGADHFVECSAVTQDGVKNVFEDVVLSALKYRKKKSKIFQKIFAR
ncbi:hypothetical protein ScPMuIL_014027 [Solemya velum]